MYFSRSGARGACPLPSRAAYSCEDRTSPSAGDAASRPANRWCDGEGIAPAATDPLTQAISKLTDVADRQLSLLAPVASPTTIHQLAAAPALEVDRSTASGEPRDPPSATLAQMVSTAPLFSQLVDPEGIGHAHPADQITGLGVHLGPSQTA